MTYRLHNINRQRDKQALSVRSLFILLFSLFLLGCEPVPSEMKVTNVLALWNDEIQMLEVSGEVMSGTSHVEIHEAGSGKLLGSAVVQQDGSFKAISSAPACSIHISATDERETYAVNNAPEDCLSNVNTARAVDLDLISTLDDNNPQIDSTIPNAVILSPPSDITINAGQAINFAGVATGSTVTPPINYYWNFGGAAPNTTVQNPGMIAFNVPGTYYIQLSATDNLGIPDPTPATRVITVTGGINSPIADTPTPVITSPSAFGGSISINVGESLYFSGSANDNTGSNNFFFEWNFSGAVPNQFGANPGNVRFNNAGSYVVSLFATNALGVRSSVPATLTVNVGFGGGGGTGFNQAPEGNIVSPSTNVTINAGDTLTFRARGSDPDNNTPLTYSWNFNGVAPDIYDSSRRSAGDITFNTPGVFTITMTTRDALGLTDPTPAIRVVTVQGFGGGFPPGGGVNNGILSAQIIAPATDVTILPGQSVFFSGQVVNATVPGPFQYFWSFDGAAPPSTSQTPGEISFSTPGVYDIQLTVTDFSGNVVGAPTTRTVMVSTGGSTTTQLGASILSPVTDTTLQVGEQVFLQGAATNTFGLTSINYRWTIRDSSGADVFTSSELSPGAFTFPQADTYRIRFRVSGRDSLSGNRVSETDRVTVLITDPFLANNTVIAQPPQDMVVNLGQLVTFIAAPVSGFNLNYRWDFDGQANDSFQANPPPVFFNQPGSFRIRLRVTGTGPTGQALNLSESRRITVAGTAQPPSPFPGPSPFPPVPPQPPVGGAATPEGIIDTPQSNLTVRVGTPILFSGRGFDPLGFGQLQFIWSFGGAAPNIRSQFPGEVSFNRVGNYVVSLLVVNAAGQVDPTPATVVITVTP